MHATACSNVYQSVKLKCGAVTISISISKIKRKKNMQVRKSLGGWVTKAHFSELTRKLSLDNILEDTID